MVLARPLSNNVLVKLIAPDRISHGLYIPETANRTQSVAGLVPCRWVNRQPVFEWVPSLKFYVALVTVDNTA